MYIYHMYVYICNYCIIYISLCVCIYIYIHVKLGFSILVLMVKSPPANAGDMRCEFYPCVGKIPWRRACNPLQHSYLENPMDRGAWWAIIYKVAYKTQPQ